MEKDGIRVAGHRGTWYVLDTFPSIKYGKTYFLEHEAYGEDAPSILIDENKKLLAEDLESKMDAVMFLAEEDGFIGINMEG